MNCPNCNLEIMDGMKFCPKCGTTISCKVPQSEDKTEKVFYPTTDTGTSDEKTILAFSELVWKGCLVLGILNLVISIGVVLQNGDLFLIGLLYIFLTLFGLFMAYVLRAFLRVVHNISINLHEINMKTK